ncbi:hypothetical protein N7519_007869 [Penicillium mononematosum]|uniref:uncharacterized protein n=1 Tax=Penicillium mononematosum TaxID=268346 RepID=UPI002546A364|nr:uncharacterized protein N7519_007869 [Penicillium mononematosum]KAJ6186568.1 hypothetical protein N7519_007869 [Penicillium mononematosum]
MACLAKTMSDPGPSNFTAKKGSSGIFTWYDEDDDLSYTLTDAADPLPPTVPLDDPKFKLVYDAGDSSAVWSVENSAFCKVKLCRPGITSEAATLEFVQKLVNKQQPDFEIP